MTDKFLGLREEFDAIRDDAMREIKKYASEKDPDRKQENREMAVDNIAEAERFINLLEQEARAGSAQMRQDMKRQVRSCKAHLDKLKNNLNKAKLMGESKERHQNVKPSSDARENLENYQKRLDRTGDYLTDAQRDIAETEDIALNVVNNLDRQREALETTRQNVDNTREATEEARGHISRLTRKALTNEICLYVVILLLLAGVVVVSLDRLGFLSGDEKDPVTPTPAP